MGNSQTTLKEEKHILRHPEEGKESEFYWACVNGGVQRVKELLAMILYEDLNKLEPNGSTPLHAASFYGHGEIVKLLLYERGCRRDRLDLNGLFAYEVAQTDEIRKLFHRQEQTNRFCDENNEEDGMQNMFQITGEERMEEQDSHQQCKQDEWLRGHITSQEIEKVKYTTGVAKRLFQSKFRMWVLSQLNNGKRFSRSNVNNRLCDSIDKNVSKQLSQYEHCQALIAEAYKQRRPEQLIRLYTLSTPFYSAMAEDVNTLGNPLYMSLYKLKERYFQGVSYRGMKMTEKNLQVYRWALKNKGIIKTLTFSSTSINPRVAEAFSDGPNITNDRRNVLLIFNFLEKCDTAIDLRRISAEFPCISEFEEEEEVLLLPFTLFVIRRIEITVDPMIIHFENISV